MHLNLNRRRPALCDAFTMVEIAICIGIIGFALVAIIGVLPMGMQVQKDNREDTIIDQDGVLLLELIRSGRVTNDLPRFVERVNVGNVDQSFNTAQQIIGLLTTPAYLNPNFPNFAEIRALSGNLAEKGTSANATNFAFKYRVFSVISPFTNTVPHNQMLATNLYELRLEFRWPLLPNNATGSGRKVFRTLVAGEISDAAAPYYYFLPLNFTD